MNRDEALALFEQVKTNNRAIEACARHRFAGGGVAKLGDKYTCQACGGAMRLPDVGTYIRGYQAAGGAANDIWPGWSIPTP